MTEPASAVLITGASGGIGVALCRAFALAGYTVVSTDRQTAGLVGASHVQAELETLAQSEKARAMFRRQVLEAAGEARLAAVVNNAAMQILGGIESLNLEQIRLSLEVNVMAPIALARSFLHELEAAQGAIVNIGSVHAHATKPGFLAYALSKSALSGLTRALAIDLAARHIRVNEVRPGATATPMLLAGFSGEPQAYAQLADYQPLGRLAEPGEVADLVVFLSSSQAKFITGAVFTIDGGVTARLHDPA